MLPNYLNIFHEKKECNVDLFFMVCQTESIVYYVDYNTMNSNSTKKTNTLFMS